MVICRCLTVHLPFAQQLSAPIVGVWQHEGGWLKEVLLSSQRVDGVSSQSPAPQLMLVQYNSQYYLQLAAGSQPRHTLQLHNNLEKSPMVKEGPSAEDWKQLEEVWSVAL